MLGLDLVVFGHWWWACLLACISLLIFGVLYMRLKWAFKDYTAAPPESWPKISIIIPCRNEAHRLPQLLLSLSKLDYPVEKLEIWLGDDRSTDRTWQILQEFANQHAHVRLLSIEAGDYQKHNGKTNALMQLIRNSSGDLLLFTDADCVVPPSWAKSMAGSWAKYKPGLITGITGMQSTRLYGRLQGLDWFLILGIVKVLDDLGFHVTSLGNNMLISREAYDAVGGFEALPFTLTEDFAMAQRIQQAGFKAYQHIDGTNCVTTTPELNPMAMLQQRKRWVGAFMQLHWTWKLGMFVRLLLPLALVVLAFQQLLLALALWCLHLFLQAAMVVQVCRRTQSSWQWYELLCFEVYFLATSLASIVLYLWPSQIAWKDRQYSAAAR
jgi:cellulose synthase/poly-beta-1,6-N-acetylglucosamine synthase-like glycosyltransferase